MRVFLIFNFISYLHFFIADIKDDSVRLQKCYKIIVHDLDSIEPIDKLVEFDVLSPEHTEELKACRTPRETNRKLLRTLMFKFKDGYQNFLNSLKDDCVHEDLAEKIMQTEVTEKDRHLLRIGNCVIFEITFMDLRC